MLETGSDKHQYNDTYDTVDTIRQYPFWVAQPFFRKPLPIEPIVERNSVVSTHPNLDKNKPMTSSANETNESDLSNGKTTSNKRKNTQVQKPKKSK
ncbi:hypothetical protein HDV02_003701 [Globomyces sp. JEL0801]|nr:hypothetical protein HDV02_003701 [Globomyces sp. JEL0801]